MPSVKKNMRRNQEKILFILMGLIIIGLIVSGYFLFVRKILPEFSTETNSATVTNTIKEIPTTAKTDESPINEFIPQEDAYDLKVYFAIKGTDKLGTEQRRVRKRNMLIAQARQIIETVLEGPVNGTFYQCIPAGTKLRGLFFDSGTFIVDLTHEFTKINNLGASEQLLAVYSLINSLTELDPKTKVRFLINGTELLGEEGHLDMSMSMTRYEELIKQ
ncbi:MAG: GerMN domain-containing protein [Candidatus Riflebacteria bacterium]|nr:GerMN domain-containing protein [Candidatus Riflebacteria bacterium]